MPHSKPNTSSPTMTTTVVPPRAIASQVAAALHLHVAPLSFTRTLADRATTSTSPSSPQRKKIKSCTVIGSVKRRLQNEGNGNAAVLEMLTVLPEEVVEVRSGDCTVDARIRCELTRELLAHTSIVLEFLLLHSQQNLKGSIPFQEKNKKILRCLLSWVRVGYFSAIHPATLPTHPLLNYVFDSLQEPTSFDLSIEVLIELVCRYEGLPQVLLSRIQYVKEILLPPTLKEHR